MFETIFDRITTQDFIDLYGEEEAIEITNLCNPLADTINQTKLLAGLNNAKDMVRGRMLIANDCGRALIAVSAKQIVLWIMRYIMDSTKARPFVDDDYDKAMEFLEYACNKCAERCPLSTAQIEEILGEGLITKSRLRCFSGYGNTIKRLPDLPRALL